MPHLSYASVEALLLESSEASPVRQAAERAAETLSKTVTQAQGTLSKTVTQAQLAVAEVRCAVLCCVVLCCCTMLRPGLRCQWAPALAPSLTCAPHSHNPNAAPKQPDLLPRTQWSRPLSLCVFCVLHCRR